MRNRASKGEAGVGIEPFATFTPNAAQTSNCTAHQIAADQGTRVEHPPANSLNERNLKRLPSLAQVPTYDRRGVTESMVHIGVGGFFRAHKVLESESVGTGYLVRSDLQTTLSLVGSTLPGTPVTSSTDWTQRTAA